VTDKTNLPVARTSSSGRRFRGVMKILPAGRGPAKPGSEPTKTYGDPKMRRIHPRSGS
jgi:hypothetical protein